MLVKCTGCGTTYRIAEEKVPLGGVKVRCPKCRVVFQVQKETEAEPETLGERLFGKEVVRRSFGEDKVTREKAQAQTAWRKPTLTAGAGGVETSRSQAGQVEAARDEEREGVTGRAQTPQRPEPEKKVWPAKVKQPAEAEAKVWQAGSPQPSAPKEAVSGEKAAGPVAYGKIPPTQPTQPGPKEPREPKGLEEPPEPKEPKEPPESKEPKQPKEVTSPKISRTDRGPEEAAPEERKEAAEAGSARPVKPPSAFRAGENDPRNLARALVSDILVYNREKRDKGLAEGKILAYLGAEIARSWELYKQRVGIEKAVGTDYFKQAVNEILGGDTEIL